MNMTLINLFIFLIFILLCVKPIGWYIAKVFTVPPKQVGKIFNPIERALARCCGIDLNEEMDWIKYLSTMLFVNCIGFLFIYIIQRIQYYLPLNPQNFSGVNPELAFNTAASFVTNTDWQAYSGEASLSHLTQTLAITVQMFLSAATGLAVLVAFIRSLVRSETNFIGNYWQDMLRGILYIFIPLSIVFSLILVSQGVIQNFKPNQQVELLDPVVYTENNVTKKQTTQQIAMGPVASLVAIKQLGTNGGGFYNASSAHPFENPNSITNYLELMAIILIPAALCYTYGMLVNDRRQGWNLLAAMILVFIPLALVSMHAEKIGNPLFNNLQIQHTGNMEGKEVRIGVEYSALWGSATTATANGSVNYMHDSAMPLSAFVYLLFMHTGEIIFGGVGCGLFGMLLTVIIAVFVAGLMVGRTPEYLGKKIEPYEMKMITFVSLVMPLLVLFCSAFACVTDMGLNSVGNPAANGLTEILYAFTSLRNNNGSALSGLNANTDFYNILGGIIMLVSRFWMMIGLLAVAGSLVRKKIIPANSGTLPTHDTVFLFFLIGVILIIGTLSFLPTLALGPIAENLALWGHA